MSLILGTEYELRTSDNRSKGLNFGVADVEYKLTFLRSGFYSLGGKYGER